MSSALWQLLHPPARSLIRRLHCARKCMRILPPFRFLSGSSRRLARSPSVPHVLTSDESSRSRSRFTVNGQGAAFAAPARPLTSRRQLACQILHGLLHPFHPPVHSLSSRSFRSQSALQALMAFGRSWIPTMSCFSIRRWRAAANRTFHRHAYGEPVEIRVMSARGPADSSLQLPPLGPSRSAPAHGAPVVSINIFVFAV